MSTGRGAVSQTQREHGMPYKRHPKSYPRIAVMGRLHVVSRTSPCRVPGKPDRVPGHGPAPHARRLLLALTGVGAEVSLEVGAFEVGLPAAGGVADIVPPPGEVQRRGALGTGGGDEHGGRGKRQQPGTPRSQDPCRGAGGRRRGQDQHHRSLRHRRAHEHGPGGTGGSRRQDGRESPRGHRGRCLHKGRQHAALSGHGDHVAKDGRAGGGDRGQRRGARWPVLLRVLW